MAVKVAEVAALRRAFPLAGVASYEERWDEPAHDDEAGVIQATVADADDTPELMPAEEP
jgi:hypothetical protein